MPEGETHQFEVTLMDIAAPHIHRDRPLQFNRRTFLITCETFAQAETRANEMKEGYEVITEITMDWEPL